MKVACYYSRAQNRLLSHPLSAILPGRCMQLTYNLSAPALEDSQYKIESMRHSTRLEQDCILHETIILEFRYFSTAPRPLLAACVGTQKIDLASDPAGHAPNRMLYQMLPPTGPLRMSTQNLRRSPGLCYSLVLAPQSRMTQYGN